MLQEQMMSFALMGGEWVLWLLVLLSVLCLTIAVERFIFSARNQTSLSKLQPVLTRFLGGGEIAECANELKDMTGMEARVLSAGLEAAQNGGAEAASEIVAGHLIFEKSKMDRGLIVIGTTGSNAPFVGLFGTVLGIIKAFNDLAAKTAEGAESVMAGISEALVATAVGLLVAIPAVILYNYFQKKNKVQLSRSESMSHFLLSRIRAIEQNQKVKTS